MRNAPLSEFVRSPSHRWAALPSGIVWCRSPELCGLVTWGRPGSDHLAAVRRAFACRPRLAQRFDLVIDGRRIDAVDPEALAGLVNWLRAERDELRRRVRLQIGIPPPGTTGVTMAGILPIVGETHPFQIVADARDAYAAAAPEGGAELFEELERAIASVIGIPPELVALRALLRDSGGNLDAPTAAARLHSSERTLQRALAKVGTTFREEQRSARYAVARELLRETDLKVSAVAARLGITERALTALFRSCGDHTPAALRRRGGDGDQ